MDIRKVTITVKEGETLWILKTDKDPESGAIGVIAYLVSILAFCGLKIEVKCK